MTPRSPLPSSVSAADFRRLVREKGPDVSTWDARGRRTPRSGAGVEAERQMHAQLVGAGLVDMMAERTQYDPRFGFIVQGAWGWHLPEPRGFHGDFCFPAWRVVLEIEGLAHAAGRGKVAADIQRRGIAGSAGWTVVSVLPSQVSNGEAMRLVLRALAAQGFAPRAVGAKEG